MMLLIATTTRSPASVEEDVEASTSLTLFVVVVVVVGGGWLACQCNGDSGSFVIMVWAKKGPSLMTFNLKSVFCSAEQAQCCDFSFSTSSYFAAFSRWVVTVKAIAIRVSLSFSPFLRLWSPLNGILLWSLLSCGSNLRTTEWKEKRNAAVEASSSRAF